MLRASFNTGPIVLAQRWGSIATPIHTLTSTTGALFTLPADIVIPVGAIPDYCGVRVRALVKRTGANATAQLEAYVGTAKTNGDSLAMRQQLNATDGHVALLDGTAGFSTSTTVFIASGIAGPQNSTSGTICVDKNTNVNRAAIMYVTLGIASANASDSFALLGYKVWIDR